MPPKPNQFQQSLDQAREAVWAKYFDALAKVYARELRRLARDAAKQFLRHHGAITAAGEPNWSIPHPDELLNSTRAANDMTSKTGNVRAEIAQASVGGVLAKYGIAFNQGDPIAQNAVGQMGQHITGIVESQRADIMASLGRSYDSGLSIRNAAKAMVDDTDISSASRGQMIARTELTGATNGAGLAAALAITDASPPGTGMLKGWASAGDDRVRDDHVDADSEYTSNPIPLNQPFLVGGEELMHPGDPSGSPEQVINCRCTVVYTQGDGTASGGGMSEPEPQFSISADTGEFEAVSEPLTLGAADVPGYSLASSSELANPKALYGSWSDARDQKLAQAMLRRAAKNGQRVVVQRDEAGAVKAAGTFNTKGPFIRPAWSIYGDSPVAVRNLLSGIVKDSGGAGVRLSIPRTVDEALLEAFGFEREGDTLLYTLRGEGTLAETVPVIPPSAPPQAVEHLVEAAEKRNLPLPPVVVDELQQIALTDGMTPKMREAVDKAVRRIAATHHIPQSAVMAIRADLSTYASRSENGRIMGLYSRGQIQIDKGLSGMRAETTFLHEYGHFADDNLMQRMSANWGGTNKFAKPFGDFVRAVRETPEYGRWHGDKSDFGKYLRSTDELWARAYSQYVAEVSAERGLGDETARAFRRLNDQWSKESFARLRPAIEELLRTGGLL